MPLADTGTSDEKEKIRAIVARRGLSGAANNTKWNELINSMRQQDEWRPSYRFKWVNGHISRWDTECWYHLPFPLNGCRVVRYRLTSRATKGQPHQKRGN
ncbi:DUF6678 family protein [Pseudomonas sp.]|uniref:DUF6678 family protein n=1 Tax=Pseudomonas sp. TaxID=306 RepID=UPI0028A9D787|nr:DUF6678 family protein [Pseudomonas sp.]